MYIEEHSARGQLQWGASVFGHLCFGVHFRGSIELTEKYPPLSSLGSVGVALKYTWVTSLNRANGVSNKGRAMLLCNNFFNRSVNSWGRDNESRLHARGWLKDRNWGSSGSLFHQCWARASCPHARSCHLITSLLGQDWQLTNISLCGISLFDHDNFLD